MQPLHPVSFSFRDRQSSILVAVFFFPDCCILDSVVLSKVTNRISTYFHVPIHGVLFNRGEDTLTFKKYMFQKVFKFYYFIT